MPAWRGGLVVVVALAIVPTLVAAGYSCVTPSDREQRRWFSDEPCPPGMVDLPLPLQPYFPDDPPPQALPGIPAGYGSARVYWGRGYSHEGHGHGRRRGGPGRGGR